MTLSTTHRNIGTKFPHCDTSGMVRFEYLKINITFVTGKLLQLIGKQHNSKKVAPSLLTNTVLLKFLQRKLNVTVGCGRRCHSLSESELSHFGNNIHCYPHCEPRLKLIKSITILKMFCKGYEHYLVDQEEKRGIITCSEEAAGAVTCLAIGSRYC